MPALFYVAWSVCRLSVTFGHPGRYTCGLQRRIVLDGVHDQEIWGGSPSQNMQLQIAEMLQVPKPQVQVQVLETIFQVQPEYLL